MKIRILFILSVLVISSTNCKKNVDVGYESPPSAKYDEYFLIVEKVIVGTVLDAHLSEPYGMAAARDGSIFVVDRGSNRVIKFNSQLVPEKSVGGFGAGAQSFNRPTFVAIDNNLNLFVSDENNRRIARFDALLNYVDEIKFTDEDDAFKFGYPSGIAVTSFGELWVADRENNRLCLFNNVGSFSRYLGEFGSAEGQLQNPEKIVVSEEKRFYMCDAGNGRLVLFDEYGNYLRKIEFDKIQFDMIEYPISIALESGLLWVVDGAESKIFLTDKNGSVLKAFGPMLPGDDTPLDSPSDVLLLDKYRVLISDSGNRRLLLCRIERGEAK